MFSQLFSHWGSHISENNTSAAVPMHLIFIVVANHTLDLSIAMKLSSQQVGDISNSTLAHWEPHSISVCAASCRDILRIFRALCPLNTSIQSIVMKSSDQITSHAVLTLYMQTRHHLLKDDVYLKPAQYIILCQHPYQLPCQPQHYPQSRHISMTRTV